MGAAGGTARVKPLDTPTGTETETVSEIDTETGPVPDSSGPLASTPRTNPGPKRPRRAERHRNRNRSKVRTEVMVLINADTLAGLNENPAELNGYGPISADTARTMILDALHWTPLLQDPATGEILNVGRTRRIPAGLKRWLQARDGTCRFPGCSVSVTHAEIDHTTPFSHGGPTDHTNLEHLCPKHHRLQNPRPLESTPTRTRNHRMELPHRTHLHHRRHTGLRPSTTDRRTTDPATGESCTEEA